MDDTTLQFHNYALRLPKPLHEIIRELAWETRTSVNIQIIDLVLYAIHEFFEKDVTENQRPPFLRGYDKEIKQIAKQDFQAFHRVFRKPDNITKFYIDIIKAYPKWRNRG